MASYAEKVLGLGQSGTAGRTRRPGGKPKRELVYTESVRCGYCQGTGRNDGGVCGVCRGKGEVAVKPPVVWCLKCRGNGREKNSKLTCLACRGVGWVRVREGATTCPACQGTGEDGVFYCTSCHGQGIC